MDSLTQIVLGAAVGEAVLGKKLGNKALLWGAIAGTIPDLDVFVGLVEETLYHRGFTHSFLFAFLMSPILGYLMKNIFVKSQATFKEWTLLYFLGFITHILLDVQTFYGTELLWPWHDRLAIGNVFVVDPLYTIPFLICVIAVMFFKRDNKFRRRINIFGLVLSTSYLFLTLGIQSYSAKKFTKSLEKQQIDYQRIEVCTTPLNAMLWFSMVETDNQFLIAYYSIFDKNDDIEFKRYDKNYPLRNKLKDFEKFQDLEHFTKKWYYLTEAGESILFRNFRFGTTDVYLDDPKFISQYVLKIDGDKLDVEGQFGGGDGNVSDILSRLFQRIKGE